MQAGRARVKRELLAETNGLYITSELSLFLSCEVLAAGFWMCSPGRPRPRSRSKRAMRVPKFHRSHQA
jgi:hypothetical protein